MDRRRTSVVLLLLALVVLMVATVRLALGAASAGRTR
jgi:hypothetical protein